MRRRHQFTFLFDYSAAQCIYNFLIPAVCFDEVVYRFHCTCFVCTEVGVKGPGWRPAPVNRVRGYSCVLMPLASFLQLMAHVAAYSLWRPEVKLKIMGYQLRLVLYAYPRYLGIRIEASGTYVPRYLREPYAFLTMIH